MESGIASSHAKRPRSLTRSFSPPRSPRESRRDATPLRIKPVVKPAHGKSETPFSHHFPTIFPPFNPCTSGRRSSKITAQSMLSGLEE